MPTFSKTNSAVLTFRFAIAAVLLAGIATFGTACGGSGSNGSDDNGNGSPGTTAPAAPSDLSGTSGDKRVRLDWSAVSEAETYTVYRSTSSSTDPSDNDPLTTGVSNSSSEDTKVSYTDTEVTNGTDYYYAVTAVNSENEESDPSSTIKKRPFAQASGLSGTSGDEQIKLDWSTAAGAETYNVYRSSSSSTDPSDNDPLATGVSDAAYTDMGVQNGTTYYYVVTSVGSDGNESAPSNEVSKTPFSEPVGRP